jgi:hypothetical protein
MLSELVQTKLTHMVDRVKVLLMLTEQTDIQLRHMVLVVQETLEAHKVDTVVW